MAELGQGLQKRQTAHKSRIEDVLNAIYFKAEGLNPNYMEISGREVHRVNIIAAVVEKVEFSSYVNFLIDDGTGRILARIFENLKQVSKVDIGHIVQVIGRPREYSSEKYILIEAIKKVDPKWAIARNKEMEGFHKTPDGSSEIRKESAPSEEEVGEDYSSSPASKIIKAIKELDKGDGVSIEDLASKNIADADKMVGMLLKEGDIFELRPGRLKVLE